MKTLYAVKIPRILQKKSMDENIVYSESNKQDGVVGSCKPCSHIKHKTLNKNHTYLLKNFS
jgi:hypothetical protein